MTTSCGPLAATTGGFSDNANTLFPSAWVNPSSRAASLPSAWVCAVVVRATPSTVANGNDIQRKKDGWFDMPFLPASVKVVPLAVFRAASDTTGIPWI